MRPRAEVGNGQMDDGLRTEAFNPVGQAGGAITPVLLCGGSAARTWFDARADLPGQFVRTAAGLTPFQNTLDGVARAGFGDPILVTGGRHRFHAAEQAEALGLDPRVLVEPQPRGTAAAALAAALWIARDEPDRLMLVLPCHHHVPDAESFAATVGYGVMAASAGRIVAFGATPTGPETGHGWMQPAPFPRRDGTLPLARFVERPDAARALRMFRSAKYLWNMGVFLCTARTLVAAFNRHAPDYVAPLRAAIRRSRNELGLLRLDAASYAGAGSETLEAAVLERAGSLSVLHYDGAWSATASVQTDGGREDRTEGGTEDKGTMAIDCRDTVLSAEGTGIALVGIGLTNVIAMATPGAVLIADRSRAEDLHLAVAALRDTGVAPPQPTANDPRPQGDCEVLTEGDGFSISRITLQPGARLRLARHGLGAGHWVLLAGEALVTEGATETRLAPNQSICLPATRTQWLGNPGREPAILIEVLTGACPQDGTRAAAE